MNKMTQEQFEALIPFEKRFKTVKQGYFSRLSRLEERELFGVYEQIFGEKPEKACAKCIEGVLLALREKYFNYKKEEVQSLTSKIEDEISFTEVEDGGILFSRDELIDAEELFVDNLKDIHQEQKKEEVVHPEEQQPEPPKRRERKPKVEQEQKENGSEEAGSSEEV